MDIRQRIVDLLAEAESLPEGRIRVDLYEQAIALADHHHDLDSGFEARQASLGSAMCIGQIDRLLVHFHWCLAHSERDPERFPEDELLWAFRWVVNEMTSFPQITRAQIDEVLERMVFRYQRVGSTLRPVHLLRRANGINLGDHDFARQAHLDLQTAKRDHLSDDHITEHSFLLSYLLFEKDYEGALRQAGPFLKGLYKSDHFEGTNAARVLVPLLRVGRDADAAKAHVRFLRLVVGNPRYINRVGNHIVFLALAGHLVPSLGLLQRHFAPAMELIDRACQFDFFYSTLLFAELVQRAGQGSVPLRLPESVPLAKCHEVATGDLARWSLEQAEELARLFDARNGNHCYGDRLTKREEVLALARPIPLPPAPYAPARRPGS